MILRTIYCSVHGCRNSGRETKPNAGFAGWGHVQVPGLVNPDTGEEDRAHICPQCRAELVRLLKGEWRK